MLTVVFSIADITPEELFNMFFGGFGGASMSGGKEKRLQVIFIYGNRLKPGLEKLWASRNFH